MSIFDDIGQFLSDVWDAIVDLFSPTPPAGPCLPCQVPIFEAHIIGVRFNSPVTAARRGAAVTGEHWTEGVDVNEPNIADGSIKPAVLLIAGRGEPGMTLRIRVTRSQNVGPTGPVTGSLGSLTFSGTEQCPTGVGDHTIRARIDQLRPAIARDAGDATWTMTVDPVGAVALGSTRLEAVTILDNPPAFFAGGDWIEALRILCAQASVVGLSQKRQAAAAVARFCHGGLGLVYDTVHGAAKFNSGSLGANGFLLAKYISPIGGKVVNCYDQAAGVTALAGALGVALRWKYMDPFGFLAQSNLVGVGPCNNPFFADTPPNNPNPVAPWNDPHRSSFGNHAFTMFPAAANADLSGPDGGVAEAIGDACAGPAVFDGDLARYVTTSVDQSWPYNATRRAAVAQLIVVDNWENSQIAAINAMPDLDQGAKNSAIASIHTMAEAARQAPRAQLAASEVADVTNGVGVNSLQFVDYSGP